MQYGLVPTDNQRMSGVVSTLKAYHCLCALGEQIDNLAFTLVPPLRADNHDVLCHSRLIAPFFGHDNPRARPFY